ncbi:unnamed protein product [Urochloa decumbens]|uniref:ACT domain-containing protein ACR n=1 Tax=Urochloa decumbens TaxID=240449 RepID=A0ABC8XKU8_9POAL
MKYVSGPYFEPDFDPLLDRFGTPGVVVDNETREDCTLVKVDSVNRDGVLLEMVQLLTDLDLVISKSYISSDGGWLMDVFHVTDQVGRKLTDPSLPEFIQRALVPSFHRAGRPSPKFTTCLGNVVGPGGPDVSDCAALEFTVHDRPGLLSSITSVLADNGCHVASGQAWTHNGRAAGVLYVTASASGGAAAAPPMNPGRWARIERLVNAVVDARENVTGERRWVRASEPVQGRVHTERRLHQLMHDDRDYESGPAPTPVDEELFSMGEKAAIARTARRAETRVSIDGWEERGYAVVKMTSRDRPRLLFDTVCALTDMHYVVFHATVGSQGPLAIQEYYIRHKDGRTVDSNAERQKVARCLVAAVERRATHGMRVEVRAADRSGLLSDFTRVLREHGLSLLRVELKRHKDEAVGIFYLVTDTGGEVRSEAVRAVQTRVAEMDISLNIVKEAPGWPPVRKTSVPAPPVGGPQAQERPRPSLGTLLWSHLGKLSNNFSSIRS